MKRALQAADNSSSQRPRIDMPATAAPPPGAAAALPPTVSAGDQKRKSSLLQRQSFFSAVANSDLTALKKLNPELVRELINEADRASGLTPLLLAVKSHNAETASWLINQGANLNFPCARGTSALMYAAKRGDCAMLQLLLAAGSQAGQADPEQRTALHHAAMQGKKEAVALLLDQGAALEHQDVEGNTALLLAVVNRHATVVSLLLERGANAAHVNRNGAFPLCYLRSEAIAAALLQKPIDLQQQSEQRSTALIIASTDGECKIATLLLDHGADINFCDRKGATALSVAIKAKRHDMVKLLLDKGADPGCTTLIRGAFQCNMLGLAAHENDIAAMQLLVQAGADVDQCAKEMMPALFYAATRNQKEAVQWLLDSKASVDAAAGDGMTALMVSSQNGHVEVVELLLQHRASTACRSAPGFNALHQAVYHGKEVCAALLLKNGASLKEKTGDGRFPLHLAAIKGHEKTIELLLDHGAEINQPNEKSCTALIYAATNGHLSALKFLLEKNADSTARSRDGRSALHGAAAKGKDEVIAELLKQPGSEIDCRDNNGATALHLAAIYGHHDAVHRLLDNGADARKVDISGWHALHKAAFNGHIAVLETLISTESDMEFIDCRAKDGCTPLLLAASQGKADVVRLLAEHGASLHVREKGGRTALHLGAAIGHAKVVEVLLPKMTPLLRVPDASGPIMMIIQEALAEAITARHAGVVEVFLRSQPNLASLDFQWHASPVIADLRNNVHLVVAPHNVINEQADQIPGSSNCVERLESVLQLSAAANDNGATIAQDWLVATGSHAVIANKLQEATQGIGALRRTLAGPGYQVSPAQNKLVCAGILASLGEPPVFNMPYSGKGLSPEVEARFNSLVLHHVDLLAQAGQEAEQALVSALGNLHGTCMSSFAGKPFHQINLYFYLTRQCGLYDIPAKRISDAFAETWFQHKQSDTAARERALAQALADRSRSREALEPIAHDSAQAGNAATFHWLLNRQLDLVNAWHKKVLGTADQ
jgi:ankyrin repeat protein